MKIFNTPFENSLRLLLILSADPETAKSVDKIAALDFIAIYAKNFGYSEQSLQGESPNNNPSEFATRRELAVIAIKQLVMRGLASIVKNANGFCYKINSNGILVADSLDTEYVDDYMAIARVVIERTATYTERQLFALINSTRRIE